MSEEKKTFKENAEQATETAKNVLFASLGLYAKAGEEAQAKYKELSEKFEKESSRLFEELVAKGQKVEGETSEKFSEVKEKSSASIEEGVAKLKESLKFSKNGDMSESLAELSGKFDQVLETLGAKKAAKKAA